MGEPFKNLINPKLIAGMSLEISGSWTAFPAKQFEREANKGLGELELKERVQQVRRALAATLPTDFPKAVDILLRSLAKVPEDAKTVSEYVPGDGLSGCALWPVTDYVAVHGLEHFDLSLEALRRMTQLFTAEFAVRPFLDTDPQRALAIFKRWSQDPSARVRRLVSEGSRPRLPWGLRLQQFVRDPAPCLPLLEALYQDNDDSVRLSVSNHLNDISKDHPALAVSIGERWLKDGRKETRKLVSHALRSLVKAGDPAALALLGFHAGQAAELLRLRLSAKSVSEGEKLGFSFVLKNPGRKEASLMVDYAIHHRKADGSLRPKVFKGTILKLPSGEQKELQLSHSFRTVTVRRYYPGAHRLVILVNGKPLGEAGFSLGG